MNPPTATPRTDDEETPLITNHRVSAETYKRMVDLARALETELAAAQAECERLKFATEGHLLKTIQQQAELARLRALFPAICSALGNGAFCTPDVSIGFLESIPNEVASVIARLRADLERFTGHGLLDCHTICDQRDAAVAERDRLRAELKELSQAYELNRVSIDELDADRARAEKAEAEVERLLIIEQQFKQSPMWDTLAIVQTRNNWKDRAEKAEAALAEWSVLNLWGGTPEIIHEFIKGQQNRIHHCQDLGAECLEQARLLGMSGNEKPTY